jgi:predicted nucleotidyltransferase
VGNSHAIERARRIAAAAAGIAGVAAISLGGSLASGLADERSDIDLHVYWRAPLADRAARAAALASLADPGTQVAEVGATYPEPTRRRVLASNPQLLRAYLGQLRKAQERSDLLFAQHRRYTIQMVFFNLLFALNRRYHPGEKRLLAHAEHIPQRPGRLRERWEQIALLPIDDPAVADLLEELVEEVSRLAEGAP